jgi:glucokinase
MNYTVGIDIGGTKIAIGLVGTNGQILTKTSLEMDVTAKPQKVIDELILVVKEQLMRLPKEAKVIGIGIGAPGPLDAKEGMITCPTNLPTWINFNIIEQFKAAFSLPVFLENDANAAALAEKWIGAGVGCENFVYLTISTGIGAGIVNDGELLNGARGNAGEIGHVVIDPSFGLCQCGQYGCLYLIASGTAIAQHGSRILGLPVTTKDVFDLYHEGHKEIVILIEKVFQSLGVGCVSLINIIDPEIMIIGGGVSKVGDSLFSVLERYVGQYTLNPSARKTKIVSAALEQDAGLIGAAALAFSKMDRGCF